MIAIFPEIVACVSEGNVEKLAVLVRKYFGGDQTYAPKPSVEKILGNAGLEFQRLPIASKSALIAKDEGGVFRIVAVINESVSTDTERFMLAHMLGHALLDIQPKIAAGDWDASGFRETQCPQGRYAGEEAADRMSREQRQFEERADSFAAALLMPKSMVRRAFEKIQDVKKCGAFFGVTEACMRRRLDDLGMLQTTPANFIEAEQKIRRDEMSAGEISPAAEIAVEDAKMPRSFAAASYSEAARDASPPDIAPTPPAQPEEPQPNTKAPQPSRGLARIRELARRIDKSV